MSLQGKRLFSPPVLTSSYIYRPYSVDNSINAAIVICEEVVKETEITGMIAEDNKVADAQVLATMTACAGTLTVEAVDNGATVGICQVIGLLVNCKTVTAAVYELRLDCGENFRIFCWDSINIVR